jgi:FkbM family methyltransferase
MQLIAGLVFLAFAIAFLWLLVRKRVRRLWQEVFAIRREIQASKKELIAVRKELLLSQISEDLRLPARLPSEDGEDLVLYNFFGRKKAGFYLEIGAYNGVELSNTYFFEALGWTGILIEPDPGLYHQCRLSRPHSKVINVAASDQPGSLHFSTAKGMEWLSFSGENKSREQRIISGGGTLERIEVPCLTLNEILKDLDQQIDFMSLDVEGYEMQVLQGFNIDKYRPRVIVIEQNAMDNESPVSNLLRQHGYSRKFHLGSNSFYVHNSDQGVFSWTALNA